MSRNVKIGLIQVIQKKDEGYNARCDLLYSAAEACLKEGAELVFFPEAFQYASDRSEVEDRELLRDRSDKWKIRCARLAKKYSAYVVPWDYEPLPDGRIRNSSYIIDRNGEEIGRYRKVHLTYGEQKKGMVNGTDFPVFDLDFGRVGIMICWDNYFPESARCLGNRGAELVLYPLFGDTLNPGWEIKLRSRAIDNGMYIASCQIDAVSPGAFTGLVDKSGNVLHRLPREKASYRVVEVEMGKEPITHTTGNPQYSENIRKMTSRCRRPDAYGALLDKAGEYSWDEIYLGKIPGEK